jgi:hypothetical protein
MLVGWAADLHARALLLLGKAEAARDWQAARGFLAEARRNVELLGRMTGLLDGPAVSIDMRRQVAVLAKLDEEELRALARAAADGSHEPPERFHPVVTLPAIQHGDGRGEASE